MCWSLLKSFTSGVKFGVVDWVKSYILRCFGHIERMKSEEFVKKVYVSEIEGPSRRGRPLGRWKARGKGYMSGATRGGGLEQAGRSVWIGRGGESFAMVTPLEHVPRESEASELWKDRQMDREKRLMY